MKKKLDLNLNDAVICQRHSRFCFNPKQDMLSKKIDQELTERASNLYKMSLRVLMTTTYTFIVIIIIIIIIMFAYIMTYFFDALLDWDKFRERLRFKIPSANSRESW